jgi:hypothetical protein
MTDITSISDDLNVFDSQVSKAGNILSVQLGSLEYAQDFGIDLKYFLDEGFRFQNESFKSYLIERLANSGINVASVIETVENLYQQYTLNLSPEETQGGLIAR